MIFALDPLHHRCHVAPLVAIAVNAAIDGQSCGSDDVGEMIDLDAGLIRFAVKWHRDDLDISDGNRLPKGNLADIP